MAIARGARRVRRIMFIGFSSVAGFVLVLLMPSLRMSGPSAGDISLDSARADTAGPGTDFDIGPGPGCPGGTGPGCPGPF